MTTEKRDIFAARLRHELTQETHVVVGDHDPERKHPTRQMGKLAALTAQYGGKLSDLLTQARRGERLGAFHDMEIAPGYTVRYGTMRGDEYLAIGTTIHEAIERAQVERDNAQAAEYVRPLTITFDPVITWRPGDGEITPEAVNRVVEDAPPRLDGPACRCHERMGNDWYFLPSDRCLYDINECRHRRKT